MLNMFVTVFERSLVTVCDVSSRVAWCYVIYLSVYRDRRVRCAKPHTVPDWGLESVERFNC